MTHRVVRQLLTSLTDLSSPMITPGVRETLIGGVTKLVQNRVVTHREIAERDDVRRWEFGTEQEYEFTLPKYYNELPDEIQRLIGRHHCQTPFVMEVPDVTLQGQEGHEVISEGKYLRYNFWRDSEPKDAARSLATDLVIGISHGSIPKLRPKPRDDLPVIDSAISLLATHTSNYTHWTQECLTKLQALNEYETRTGDQPVIIVPSDPPSFIPESLDVMGYNEDEYVEWEHQSARVRRLVVPSVRRCLSDTSNDWIRMSSAFDWIRDRALDDRNPVGDNEYASRVLISREDATTRRMTNRQAVETALEKRGFETYVPGEMSYREQVKLFSGAELVVGTHGAGLVNAIYGVEADVVELYGKHFLPANFELAQGQGRNYGCLKCEPVGRDVQVDVDELLEAVGEMNRER